MTMIGKSLLPIQGGELGDQEVEKDGVEGGGGGLASNSEDEKESNASKYEMEPKVEELQRRVAEHFEDANDKQVDGPLITRAQRQPTREEWEVHQTTHTPCEAWCTHCVAARVVRRGRPSKQKRAHIVPDIDKSAEGPTTVSMDYMYFHDRIGRYKEPKWNTPYLVVVEHRRGRT